MAFLQLKMYQSQIQQQQQPTATVLYTTSSQPVALTVTDQVFESYKTRQSVIAGAILITVGGLSIVFNAAGIVKGELFSFFGHGIVCGLLVSKVHCTYWSLLPL